MKFRTERLNQRSGLLGLSLHALLMGLIAGFGAALFRDLTQLIHKGLFLGTFSAIYAVDASPRNVLHKR